MRRPLPHIVVLVFGLLVAFPARAEPLSCTFWIDSLEVDLAERRNLQPLLNVAKPRLIVPVFTAGHTLFPTRSNFFKIMPRYDKTPDLVASIIQQVKARGGEIYLGVECYRWDRPDAAGLPDVLAKRLDWAETAADGKADTREGRFASPFHPEVQAALKDLIQEIAERYPTADGIFLDTTMALSNPLAFSPASRAHHLQVRKSVAPASAAFDPKDQKASFAVFAWAGDRCTGIRDFFFNAVVLELRKRKIEPRFAITSRVRWRGLKPADALSWPCDWVQFRNYHYVNEVYLQHDWTADTNGNDVTMYEERKFLTKNTQEVFNAVLPPFGDSKFNAALTTLYGQFVERFTVRVQRTADVARAARFASATLKELPEKPMRCTSSQLQHDWRLTADNGIFPDGFHSATFAEGMAKFAAITGIPFALHPDIDPEATLWQKKHLAGGRVAPWFVMGLDVMPGAVAANGHWARFGDGYMLVPAKPIYATPKAVAAVSAGVPPPVGELKRNWWWWALGMSVLIAGVTVFLWRYRRRALRPEAGHA
jgi:hypothetical protein